MDRRQQEIDFSLCERLGMLRDARLIPRRSRDGVLVSPAMQKSVLRVIDDHARGRVAWLGFERISQEAGISVRSAKRAVEALCEASLLAVERRRAQGVGVVCNHYAVVWSELALLCRRELGSDEAADETNQSAVAALCSTDQSAVATDQSAVATDQSAVATDQSAVATNQSAVAALKPPIPPLNTLKPPPPQPLELRTIRPKSLGSEWLAAAAEFGQISKIRALAAAAEAAGESVDEWRARVAAALATAEEARRRGVLRSVGGSVAYFLEFGAWPAEAVERPAAPRVQSDARDRRRAVEFAAAKALSEFRELRRNQVCYTDALDTMRAKYPAEVCEANGWT